MCCRISGPEKLTLTTVPLLQIIQMEKVKVICVDQFHVQRISEQTGMIDDCAGMLSMK